jgi:DNA primase
MGGKDPGDVATANPRSWREMVAGSVLYWDFLIDSACQQNDPKTGAGAQAISTEVIPAITQIANSVVRAHYITELAKRLAVPEESIYSEIERNLKKKELNNLKATVTSIEKGQMSRREEVEQYALSLALQFYPDLKELLSKLEEIWIVEPAVAKILGTLKKWDIKTELKIQALSQSLPEELQGMVDNVYLRDMGSVREPVREWKNVIQEMHDLYVRAELKRLAAEIAIAEKKGEGIEALQARFASLSKR